MDAANGSDGNGKWIVLTDHSDRFSSEFRAGALAYAREIGFPNICLAGDANLLAAVRAVGPARVGVINHVRDAPAMAALRRLGVPCILLGEDEARRWRAETSSRSLACVVDHQAIGRMAAEYYLEQGRFKSHLYVDTAAKPHWSWWSEQRFAGFRAALGQLGAVRAVRRFSLTDGAARRAFLALARRLPPPVAVFCANDRVAYAVLQLCQEGGLYVPGEIAVLGVDNAQEICEHAPIGLSSIEVDRDALGARAVAWMLNLLAGAASDVEVLRGLPRRVVERNSTRRVSFDDPFVARAAALIAGATDAKLTVAKLVRKVGASRSYLERHFKLETGYTLHDYLEGEVLREVCRLLEASDKPVTYIAATMGYASPAYLCTKFRRRYGMTMQDYRNHFRHGRAHGCRSAPFML